MIPSKPKYSKQSLIRYTTTQSLSVWGAISHRQGAVIYVDECFLTPGRSFCGKCNHTYGKTVNDYIVLRFQ